MKNKKLRVFRILAELSQRDLAKEAGISQGKYSFIESGKIFPTKDEDRKAIAEALAKALSTKQENIRF